VSRIVAYHVDVDGEMKKATVTPSLVVSSGRGFHAYWYTTGLPDVSRAKGINKGLALAVGGDTHCCDAPRILRVPSFVNNKRPVRLVTILTDTGAVYDDSHFDEFYVEPNGNGAHVEIERTGHVPFALSLRLEHFLTTDRDARDAWRGQVGDGSSDSRYILVAKMRPFFSPSEIAELVCSRDWVNRRTGLVKDGETVERDVALLLSKGV